MTGFSSGVTYGKLGSQNQASKKQSKIPYHLIVFRRQSSTRGRKLCFNIQPISLLKHLPDSAARLEVTKLSSGFLKSTNDSSVDVEADLPRSQSKALKVMPKEKEQIRAGLNLTKTAVQPWSS